MLCSPNSFTMTATRFMSGRLSSRLMSVVLPLPRKPVTMLTGIRPASASRPCASGSVCRFTKAHDGKNEGTWQRSFPTPSLLSDIHLEDVQPAREPVDCIDDAAL